MNSIRENLLNNTVTFGVELQGDGDHIKVPLFNTLSGSVYLLIDVLGKMSSGTTFFMPQEI